ncbi:hypothetical protein HBH56_220200 [Parastagonospora nodorum]|uniref:Uncharacterized protein n=1 Tax=Phaeosphaeria nodorum (strain SN15 / ATCC MYA-4574 / FGSC 10173) TaxID=321614 RepID=A0A7U2I491_PHANO|nr:hypothetical protein HBH56_220200 [Parastagonospora nodorum]QRD01250.1 hypothetical protein JI435_416350 [Parastagonospora nodorum SN15]KAH3922025.1 hypothetical protein HBH54_230330 [Parastagonospora nodorum]KAH3941295.1 hypothetical protein HBH53_204290 [Parastagonospora nodorum]KAH3961096.1 hypothetical protein HBH52_231910 [Parastagonospora nodorum]
MGRSDARSRKTSRARDLQFPSRLMINHARKTSRNLRIVQMDINRSESYQKCKSAKVQKP